MILQNFTSNISYSEILQPHINLLEHDIKYYCPLINQDNCLDAYIYNLVKHNIIKKNIDSNNYVIQYELHKNNNLQIEYNKQNKTTPIFTILCFFSENPSPVLFSEVNTEEYKYEDFKIENKICIYFPQKNIHTIFDSSKYYGILQYDSIINEQILKINIWNNYEISNFTQFNTDLDKNYLEVFENINFYEQECVCDFKEYIYNDNTIFKNIFFNTNSLCTKEHLYKMIQNKKQNSNIISINYIKQEGIDYLKLISEYGDIIKDSLSIINETEIVDKNNIFYRNKIIQNILPKEVCYWILNDCFNYKSWNSSTYKNYEYQINLETFPHVLNYILFMANFWLMEIRKMYMISSKLNLNIKEYFIAKYTSNKVINEQTADGSFLIMNIQLNDKQEYNDGEIIFTNDNDKEDIIKLEISDCIIYNGKKMRTPGYVSKGEKFVLVIIIELIL